jgi:NADH dehydrogenase
MAISHRNAAQRDQASMAHVVIIGGGFAGIGVARGLSDQDVRVTIIDQHNFHTFQPLLYQVATAGLEPADVAYPIRTIFGSARNVRFRHGRVRTIDHPRGVVILSDGVEIAFDHLVVATGAIATFFGVPGAKEFAFPLYSLTDARRLRNRLLSTLERADVAADDERVGVTFVVVGGGPTGVETSGALSELINIVIRRDGLRLDASKVRVVLVDVAPRLLTQFPDSASQYAMKHLESMGVEVDVGRSVVAIDATSIHFSDGERLEAAAVVWAAGVSAGDALPGGLSISPGSAGRAIVAPDLRLVGTENVWVVGDAAAIPQSDGSTAPMLAPVAIQSGRHCAEQILRVVHGQATTPFRYHNKGIMATIGRNAAVAKVAGGPGHHRSPRLARVAGAAPVVPHRIPQQAAGVDQLDVALLRLEVRSPTHRR